jgi:hypothetical protein
VSGDLLGSGLFGVLLCFCSLGLAVQLARETEGANHRLTALSARPIAFTLNRLYPWLPAIAGLVTIVAPPQLRLAIVVLVGVMFLVPRGRLLFVMTGGRDDLTDIRRGWDELEQIAWGGDHGALSSRWSTRLPRASRVARVTRAGEVLGRLEKIRTAKTDEFLDLLAAQAPCWMEPAGDWSRSEILREMRLYEIGSRLWPKNPPWTTSESLGSQFLWDLMDAYRSVLERLAPEPAGPIEVRPAGSALPLERFRRPETQVFLDLVARLEQLAERWPNVERSELERLRRAAQDEVEHIFPGIWVFRGAVAEPRT